MKLILALAFVLLASEIVWRPDINCNEFQPSPAFQMKKREFDRQTKPLLKSDTYKNSLKPNLTGLSKNILLLIGNLLSPKNLFLMSKTCKRLYKLNWNALYIKLTSGSDHVAIFRRVDNGRLFTGDLHGPRSGLKNAFETADWKMLFSISVERSELPFYKVLGKTAAKYCPIDAKLRNRFYDLFNDRVSEVYHCTPLILSVSRGNIELVRALLKRAENNVNEGKDSEGKTALWHAVNEMNLDMFKILIEHGADVDQFLCSAPTAKERSRFGLCYSWFKNEKLIEKKIFKKEKDMIFRLSMILQETIKHHHIKMIKYKLLL